MKTLTLTQAQLQEIAGRLDAITRFGIAAAACEHVLGIQAVLGKIIAAANEPEAEPIAGGNAVPITQSPKAE